MLIIATKKSRTPCCKGCQQGKPCADKIKPKYVAQPSGLLLPDRRVIAPRSMLYGTPGELEGVRPSWNRPLLMPVFSMACSPCCTGTVSTECCDNVPISLTIYITNKVGACSCVPDQIALNPLYDPVTGAFTNTWQSVQNGECEPAMSLFCDAVPQWVFSSNACLFSVNPTTESCDPFELTFVGITTVASASCCAGGFDARIAV